MEEMEVLEFGVVRWEDEIDQEIRKTIGMLEGLIGDKTMEEAIDILGKSLDSFPCGVALGDLQGRLIYANPATVKLWGFEHEAGTMPGRPIIEFWRPDERIGEVLRVLKERKSWIGELTRVKQDGGAFPTLVITSLLMDESDRLLCQIALFVDRTDREDAALERFGSQLEDQIKNPLSVIMATLQHLREQVLEGIGERQPLDLSELKGELERCERNARECGERISNLVSSTRGGGGG